MKHTFVTAAELKNTSGAVLDQTHKQPVGITEHGRLTHIVMDLESYEVLAPEAAEAIKKVAREAEIKALMDESFERFGDVYEHLAK